MQEIHQTGRRANNIGSVSHKEGTWLQITRDRSSEKARGCGICAGSGERERTSTELWSRGQSGASSSQAEKTAGEEADKQLHETCADEYGLARGSSVSVKHLSSHTILISAVTGILCRMSWD